MKNQSLSNVTITGVLILAFLLAGCQPKSGETAEPQAGESPTEESVLPPQPGEPMAVSSELVLDPAVTEDADSLLVSGYLYEGLVRLDEAGNVQPGIADSWIVSDDQLDYIFEIRPDARFSDGSPITTDVIVDNFNRWFDPAHPLHGGGNYPTWPRLFPAFNGERDAENRAVSRGRDSEGGRQHGHHPSQPPRTGPADVSCRTRLCHPQPGCACLRQLWNHRHHRHLQRTVRHLCMDRYRDDSQPQSKLLEPGGWRFKFCVEVTAFPQ
ncbi:MAG: hypothetical protein HND47_11820 [Chloroflexi bacterium]|nr:hypothetical protein [Chloroflexota bacterium]